MGAPLCNARPDPHGEGETPLDWRDAEIARLRKALEDLANSGRTKTGMKEQARRALFPNTPGAAYTADSGLAQESAA